MKLGIRFFHGRAYHPQTQGKIERFHRTLKQEWLSRFARDYVDYEKAQESFDRFRSEYNQLRPHASLEYQTPSDVYRASSIDYPESVPDYDYEDDRLVRRVGENGKMSFKGYQIKLGKGLRKERVYVKPTSEDGIYDVYFINSKLKQVDLSQLEKC